MHGVGEAHVEGLVVLHQRGLLVVEHQLLQAAVEVKGRGEAEALRRAEHHAVLHLAVHAGDTQDRDRDRSDPPQTAARSHDCEQPITEQRRRG